MKLDDHFFRRESGRIVAALINIFGVQNLDLAEDVTQDAFCRALEVWKIRGVPANPPAWLMVTAKNRALDVLRRERSARTFAPEVGRLLESEWALVPTVDQIVESKLIGDDRLRVMFSCCDSRLKEESQISLILNILCGFSVSETASALFTSRSATEKRLSRAKKVLANSKRLFDLTSAAEFNARLPAVQRALYLLFNEGYHGASPETVIRSELCHEAIRLTRMLLDHPFAETPVAYALAAVMCLHAARLPGRLSSCGDLMPLSSQDRSLWDHDFIREGARLLELSAVGSHVSEYHVEAMIALLHAQASRSDETDWHAIIALYDLLYARRPTPVVALNRGIAIAQMEGPKRGIEVILSIEERSVLANYPFYWASLGELRLRMGCYEDAYRDFSAALDKARNPWERRFFDGRLKSCIER